MKPDTASALARLRSALYNPSKSRKPGTCVVLQADLEFLLAEVEQLSNAQMARYLIRITLEALNNGEQGTAPAANRQLERSYRRRTFLRRAHRPAADCGMAEVGELALPETVQSL